MTSPLRANSGSAEPVQPLLRHWRLFVSVHLRYRAMRATLVLLRRAARRYCINFEEREALDG